MRTGIAISALGHVAIVVSIYLSLASPRLFESRSPQAIAIDIVSAQELDRSAKPERSAPAQELQQSAKPEQSAPVQEAAADPKPEQTAAPASRPSPPLVAPPVAADIGPAEQMMRLEPSAPAAPASPAEPQVPEATRLAGLLHMPTPDEAPVQRKDGFDAPAIAKAKLTAEEIAAFRARVKQCWSAPPGLSAAQHLRLVIRLTLKPDGGLSGEPMLLEASASPQGPLMLKSLVAALERCQPYSVLPPQKYKEWRVLDVAFSPRDLLGG